MARQLWLVGLLLCAVLAGCSGNAGAPEGGNSPAPSSGGLKVGMVTDKGGIGDLSFNYMASEGLKRAKSELGFQTEVVESKQESDYAGNLERLAERGCNAVFAIGFALEPAVKEVAPRYPNTRFILIDAAGPAAENVAGVQFREEEGAYLVGALAAGMSKTDQLGFVGGMEIPLIKKFEAGYRAGILTLKPSAKVTAKYTNNWEDVARGKELALSLYEGGADVVMHASGRCGLGVIEAAKEKGPGFWAIGVDADQDYLGCADSNKPAPPSRVLTSMMKRVDNAVFAVCQDLSQGKFESGPRTFSVRDNGVGLSPLKYTRDEIPADLLARVEKLREMIAEGKLTPPSEVEALDSFAPPRL